MKDILINYPIKILQQELINIRTSYRLEKKRIIEILKDMKSIKKLTKEELIDLLIKYNYDISKLPKLEDLIKPKKERKPRAKKELLKRKEELLKLKLEEERKKFKKYKLFDIDDEQSLNIYIALKKNNIGYDEEIFDKLINNNKLIIELKKDIFEETNYDNFLNLKNKIQELYKEINEYELILDKQGEEIEKKRIEEIKKKRNEELKKNEELKNSTYIPSNYLFNKEYYFDNNIWEKNYTMKDLIENWDTDIIPIIFLKVEPKIYDIFETMVKKVNGIISKKGLKKDTSILIPELLVFTKEINKKILEYYIKEAGTIKYKYKYAIDKLYRGVFRIIERIYIENDIPRKNITNVFGDDQETLYLRGVRQGLPVRTLQAASKELLLFDDKIGTFIRNPETLLLNINKNN